MSATGQTVIAPAKLTVTLRMTGIRDDGFHLIDAEMVSLDLADTLTFYPRENSTNATNHLTGSTSLTTELAGPARHGLPVTDGPDNLIRRALVAVEREADVHVIKHIPAGAGLGGGSSNAAAVFRWAGRTRAEDIALSARLGADVPFCILNGRARVTGIGEILEPLPFIARTYTLVLPPFGVSTPAVYRAWDQLGGPTGPHGNDLELAALDVEPRLAQWRDRLGEHTGVTPQLAGSGSTWFVAGDFPGEGFVVAHTTASTSTAETTAETTAEPPA
jgi:4-diphosphocytidyl-2-C-methyl-D-erythritol kinase